MNRLIPFFTSTETTGSSREPRLPTHAQDTWNRPGFRNGYPHCGGVQAFILQGTRPVWYINGYRFVWCELVALAELTAAEQEELIQTYDLDVQVCIRQRDHMNPNRYFYLEPVLRVESRTIIGPRLSAHDPPMVTEYSWPVYGRVR